MTLDSQLSAVAEAMQEPSADQREAVARLTTYCERMIARGQLPTLDEMNLRVFVNNTCAAFGMALVQDRETTNARC